MKSRLTGLFLVLVMLLSMFTLTSCGDDTSDLNEEVAQPMTITLYSIKGDGTSDTAVASVEKALNRISRNLYNTNLKLVLYTEAEYDAKLAAQMQKSQQQAALNPSVPSSSNEKGTNYETVERDGFVEYVYPDLKEGQLDIFLVRNENSYLDFVKKGVLTDLSSLLDNPSFASINTYTNLNLMNAMKVNGKTYAIPTNHLIGSATYLLLDREVMDALGYTPDTMTSLGALQAYLQAVKATPAYAEYAPLLNCANPAVNYLQDGTMIGTTSADTTAQGNAPTLLLNDADYVAYLAAKQAYEQMGYLTYGAFDGTQNCGATFISGVPGAVEALYGDKYYTVRFSDYTAARAEMFESMYVIGKNCVNASRCMEIITLLTMNEEFRNIFQYGVEGEHYTVDDSGTRDLISQNGTYVMNPLYTGNEFLLRECMTMDAGYLALREEKTYAQTRAILGDLCADDEWSMERSYAMAKCLNNSVRFDPYDGFALTADDKAALTAIKGQIDTITAGAAALLPQPTDTLADYITALVGYYQAQATTLSADATMIALLDEAEATSLVSRFLAWYK